MASRLTKRTFVEGVLTRFHWHCTYFHWYDLPLLKLHLAYCEYVAIVSPKSEGLCFKIFTFFFCNALVKMTNTFLWEHNLLRFLRVWVFASRMPSSSKYVDEGLNEREHRFLAHCFYLRRASPQQHHSPNHNLPPRSFHFDSNKSSVPTVWADKTSYTADHFYELAALAHQLVADPGHALPF